MKIRSSIFLGLFFVVGAQSQITACAPADDSPGSGGVASTGGAGTGGAGTGGTANGTGGAGSGGVATGAGGQVAGIGGTAPALTCGVSPGAGGASEVVEPTFETVQFIVEQTPCNGSDCHGHEGNELDLKVDTPDELYTHLTETVSDECGGLKVVVPGDPDASALVRLLKGRCGSLAQMPDGCTCDPDPTINNCLPPQYVDAVEKWVRAGALK